MILIDMAMAKWYILFGTNRFCWIKESVGAQADAEHANWRWN